MVKVARGRPFGERLMWRPLRGAEAVKKTGWARAQVEMWEGILGVLVTAGAEMGVV
jgi:hypothetical protein